MRATPIFEKAVTKITARHITKDVSNLTVTANAEQIPNTCKAMGLLLKIGCSSISFALGAVIIASFQCLQKRSKGVVA